MKVLVLGLPRTGTQSLADALAILGISPVYHMREVAKNKHQDLWIEALEAKFEGKGQPWGREDFERILQGYEGLADYPAAIFPAELIAAYPEAAIILSTRDEDSWTASILSTLWHAHINAPAPAPASGAEVGQQTPVKSLRHTYTRHCWGDDFPKNASRIFHDHHARFRESVGDRKFLEYKPGDGWTPLCDFLGVQVPDVPYPRQDDWAKYKSTHKMEDAPTGKTTGK